MNRLFALCFSLLVSASATPGSLPQFHFSGELLANHHRSMAFGIPVSSGYVQYLDLESGLRLELSAPREDGDDAVTYVRLLKEEGGYYKVLHEARSAGSSAVERSFTYLVCGSEVTFFAPAPEKTPVCARA